MAAEILIVILVAALAILPAFVGIDNRDGRDWQPRSVDWDAVGGRPTHS